jgi:nucleotide-binding universal stress UspA family protein
MLEIKLVLCPIDFSEISGRAYRHALSLSEHYQAKLVVLYIVEEWRHPSASWAATAADLNAFYGSLIQSGWQQLRDFVKEHTHIENRPEMIVEKGTAPDKILSFAKSQEADLIVMGAHGQRGFDRLVLGSTTDRVMRTAPCPVMVVPSQDSMAAGDESYSIRRLRRVLFCADFSDNSAGALDYAISAAAEYDAELTLLHVVEPGLWANVEDATARATEQLGSLLSEEVGNEGRNVKMVVRVGRPYQELIQYAQEERPDIATMGIRGRGSLDLAVFGSTTYRVLQLGSCPVLVVRS